MPLNRSKVRYKHAGHRRVGWVTPEFYDAAGSGSVNDYTAFNAAVQDLVNTDGGGEIWLTRPGARYRLDSMLTLPGTVSIRAFKGAGTTETALIRNHIFPLLSITNDVVGDNETSTVIEGVTFTDAAGGGAMVVVAEGSADFARCAMLGVAGITDSSQPLVLMQGGAGARCRLSHCHLAPVNAQSAVKAVTGAINVDGGTVLKVPATYTGDVVAIASNDANAPAYVHLSDGTYFDASGHTSGAVVFVTANGSSWAVCASGCLFRGGSVTSTAFVWTNSGVRRVNVGANTWVGVTNRYLPSGGVSPLTLDSDLALKPYVVIDAPGTAYTLPVGVRTVAIRMQSTAPMLTMPQALFAGQEMTVTIYNESGGDWAGVGVVGLYFGGSGAVNDGTGRSFRAVAVDRDLSGTYEWVIASPWSDAWI